MNQSAPKASVELRAAAMENAPALIWMSDADYEGTYFNKTWLRFTGRTEEEELQGGWISGVHPDDRPAISAYRELLERREPFQAEYRLRRHDGEWRWMLDNGQPITGADGAFLGYVGTCIDITDRKTAEIAALRMREQSELAQEAADFGISTGMFSPGVSTGLLKCSLCTA